MKRMLAMIVTLMGFALAPTASAQSWSPEPWKKYLIDMEVKRDTATLGKSIMLTKHITYSSADTPPTKSAYRDIRNIRFMTLDEWEEAEEERRAMREGYSTSNFIGDILTEIVNIFLDNK